MQCERKKSREEVQNGGIKKHPGAKRRSRQILRTRREIGDEKYSGEESG